MFHGSWVPLVGLAAVLKVAGGLWLAAAMSVVDGRQQVAEREAKREEAKKVT
jgi:Na+(H+)/acetate symporter ActP